MGIIIILTSREIYIKSLGKYKKTIKYTINTQMSQNLGREGLLF